MIRRQVMSAQKSHIKEQVAEVVVENPNESVVKSLDFMKQLTVVAVSTIAYMRVMFPSDCFEMKRLAGQNVFVLRGCEEVPGTRTLVKWIKGAFDLVHSHHLKKMILVVEKDSITLEIYKFSFSYNHDAIYYDVMGEVDGKEVVLEQSQGLPEDIAASVRQLLRCVLVHVQSLQHLPKCSDISVKIELEGDTPTEVIPDCFQRFDDELNFPEEVETMKLGKITTKFSTFAISSKSVMSGESYSHEKVNQEENAASEEDVDDEIPGSQCEPLRLSSLPSNIPQRSQNFVTGNKSPEHDSNSTNLSEKLSIVSLKEKPISCICGCNDLLDATVKCVSCSTFQHKACYKLLECHQVETHVCIECHSPSQGKLCSVPELLNDANRKQSAQYRQALLYCCDSPQISCKRIMTHLKVRRLVAEKIFQQLDSDGCLQPATNKGYVRYVKPDFKENILGRYFSAPPSTDPIPMDIQQSSPVRREINSRAKRQLYEEKENSPPEYTSSPQPKRSKILKTTKNIKRVSHIYN